MKYSIQAALEKIEAFYKTIESNERVKDKIRELKNAFFTEIKTTANQYLVPHKLKNYMKILAKENGIDKCADFYQYCLVVKAKYLSILAIFLTYTNQQKRLEMEFKDFNLLYITLTKYLSKLDPYNSTKLVCQDKELLESSESQSSSSEESETESNEKASNLLVYKEDDDESDLDEEDAEEDDLDEEVAKEDNLDEEATKEDNFDEEIVKEERTEYGNGNYLKTKEDESKIDQHGKEENVHIGIQCDGCRCQIYGARYTCLICPDTDLCKDCESNILHKSHTLFKIASPETTWSQNMLQKLIDLQQKAVWSYEKKIEELEENPMIAHSGCLCDTCGKQILGHRYICIVCDNHNLCMNCQSKGFHPHHNAIRMVSPKTTWYQRSFNKLKDLQSEAGQAQTPFKSIETLENIYENSGIIHFGIRCDACGGEVIGNRYKCYDCKDYDLCKSCEKAGYHPLHKILRSASPGITFPSFATVKMNSVYQKTMKSMYGNDFLCNDCKKDVTGRRYYCTVCPQFDLCVDCEFEGAHSEHIMIRKQL